MSLAPVSGASQGHSLAHHNPRPAGERKSKEEEEEETTGDRGREKLVAIRSLQNAG